MIQNQVLTYTVLGVVAVAQACLWLAVRSSCKRAKDQEILNGLAEIFSEDIKRRARNGRGPDWLHYLDEGQRQFELRIDRLRTFAAMALAIGLGGTILSLFANLFFELYVSRPQKLDVEHLAQGTILSLFGSLVGVIVHLIIVLFYMTGEENSFSEAFHDWKNNLHGVSRDHEPREAFSEELLKVMEQTREILNVDVAGILSTAIPGFPKAVAVLGENLDRLSQVVEKQGSVIEAAVANLQGTASAMEQLAPAAQVLAGASAALGALPEKLESTLTESRERWLADLRQEEGVHLESVLSFQRELEEKSEARERQMAGLVVDLQHTVAEVREEIGRTPSLLTETIAGLSRQLGIEFGQHARDSNNELATHLKDQQGMLLLRLEQREQELRNNIGLIVMELFDKLSGTIENKIVDQLSIVGGELGRAAEALPVAAQRFEDASESWYRTQEEALQDWGATGDRIQEAARLLSGTNGQFQAMAGSIDAAADHLERVAKLTDGFEESLRQAFEGAAAKPLADLANSIERAIGIVASAHAHQERLEKYQEQLEKILNRQSDFIINSLGLVVGKIPPDGHTPRDGDHTSGSQGSLS